jgi:hypothetical protein
MNVDKVVVLDAPEEDDELQPQNLMYEDAMEIAIADNNLVELSHVE